MRARSYVDEMEGLSGHGKKNLEVERGGLLLHRGQVHTRGGGALKVRRQDQCQQADEKYLPKQRQKPSLFKYIFTSISYLM